MGKWLGDYFSGHLEAVVEEEEERKGRSEPGEDGCVPMSGIGDLIGLVVIGATISTPGMPTGRPI